MYATSTVYDLGSTALTAWIVGITLIVFLAFFGSRR
jgi:hypothetical protein